MSPFKFIASLARGASLSRTNAHFAQMCGGQLCHPIPCNDESRMRVDSRGRWYYLRLWEEEVVVGSPLRDGVPPHSLYFTLNSHVSRVARCARRFTVVLNRYVRIPQFLPALRYLNRNGNCVFPRRGEYPLTPRACLHGWESLRQAGIEGDAVLSPVYVRIYRGCIKGCVLRERLDTECLSVRNRLPRPITCS